MDGLWMVHGSWQGCRGVQERLLWTSPRTLSSREDTPLTAAAHTRSVGPELAKWVKSIL